MAFDFNSLGGSGHDPAVVLFGDVFGTLIQGSSATSTTMIASYVSFLNSIVLAVAGMFFLYQLVTASIQTAHEGEFLGRQWSSVWVPIRFLMAGVAMVPVNNGYCLMQELIGEMITVGLDAGGAAWSNVQQQINAGIPITNNYVPNAQNAYMDLAKKAFRIGQCRWEANWIAGAANVADGAPHPFIDVGTSAFLAGNQHTTSGGSSGATNASAGSSGAANASTGSSNTPVTYAWTPKYQGAPGFNANDCGSITFTAPKKSMNGIDASAITNAAVKSIDTLMNDMDSLAMRSVAANWPGATDDDKSQAPTVSQFITIMNNAATTYRNGVQQTLQTAAAVQQLNQQTQAGSPTPASMAAANGSAANGGWLYVGTFYNRLAIVNDRLNEVISAIPDAGSDNIGGYVAALHSPANRDGVAQVDNAGLNLILNAEASLVGENTGTWASNGSAHFEESDSGRVVNTMKRGLAEEKTEDNILVAKIKRQLAEWLGNFDNKFQTFHVDEKSPVQSIMNFGIVCEGLGSAGIAATVTAGILLDGFGDPAVANIIKDVAYLLVLAGGFMAHVVPMMPYWIWMISVTSYAILCLEAVVASVFWAFAHLKAEGEAIHGSATAGYMIVFNLLLRPTLMVGGFIGGMALVTFSITALNLTWNAAANDVLSNSIDLVAGGGVLNVISGSISYLFQKTIGGLARVFVYYGLAIYMIERSFALTHLLPDVIARWFGGAGENLGEESGHGNVRGLVSNNTSQVQSTLKPGDAQQKKKDQTDKGLDMSKVNSGGDKPNSASGTGSVTRDKSNTVQSGQSQLNSAVQGKDDHKPSDVQRMQSEPGKDGQDGEATNGEDGFDGQSGLT